MLHILKNEYLPLLITRTITLLHQALRNAFALANHNIRRSMLLLTKNLNPMSSSPTKTTHTMDSSSDNGDCEHTNTTLLANLALIIV